MNNKISVYFAFDGWEDWYFVAAHNREEVVQILAQRKKDGWDSRELDPDKFNFEWTIEHYNGWRIVEVPTVSQEVGIIEIPELTQ